MCRCEALPTRSTFDGLLLPGTGGGRGEGQQRVGFDRPSIREQWPFKNAELTFVIERLLWNALLALVHCRSAAGVGHKRPSASERFLAFWQLKCRANWAQ